MKYAHLVTTDHMGSTCAHHYPHTKFHHCSPYITLDIWFFVISQSEQICKWGMKYAHSVTTDHMGSTCAPPLPTYQVWWKSVIAFSLESEGLPFDVDKKPTSLHTSVHQTALQMKTKWSFQLRWRPAKRAKACRPFFFFFLQH